MRLNIPFFLTVAILTTVAASSCARVEEPGKDRVTVPAAQQVIAPSVTNSDIDANKGVAISTLRDLYVLKRGTPDCYFCQRIAGKWRGAQEMYDLVKGDPAPKAHYTCDMKGIGYWVDVEKQCPQYAGLDMCGDIPGDEFWVELTRREYANGVEISYDLKGRQIGGATEFTPKLGSVAKPESTSYTTPRALPSTAKKPAKK